MKKLVCFFCIAIYITQAFGQDTLSLYFETGKSKITDKHIYFFNSISTKYDLSDLDSVHYIGAADPTGNFQSNLRLSEKRAKNTANYCKELFPKTVNSTIIALGAVSNQERAKSRKVDIVLYFKLDKEEITIIDSDSIENFCYYIDYELLHRSYIRTIIKQREEYIMIEALVPDLKKRKEHYYGTINSEGKFEIHQVKWGHKRMGKNWWRSYQTTATIPKKDFDTYKIFKIEEPPCSSACNEDFSTHAEIAHEEKNLHLDTFLMRKIQFKVPFLRRNRINIRAPKEYVYIQESYFIGCDSKNKLHWHTKRGKRKQNYYYSYLPVIGGYAMNISRLMSDCKHAPEPSQCGKPMFSSSLFAIDKSFLLNVEVGSRYFASKVTAYVGLEIAKEWEYSRIAAQFALEYNLRFHGSLNYHYHFFSFPFYKTKDFFGWASPSNYPLFSRYARLYAGAELRSGINKEKKAYIEQGLFLGFVYVDYNIFLSRIYIQVGAGFDYLRNLLSTPYPTIQAGITMRIARLIRF